MWTSSTSMLRVLKLAMHERCCDFHLCYKNECFQTTVGLREIGCISNKSSSGASS